MDTEELDFGSRRVPHSAPVDTEELDFGSGRVPHSAPVDAKRDAGQLEAPACGARSPSQSAPPSDRVTMQPNSRLGVKVSSLSRSVAPLLGVGAVLCLTAAAYFRFLGAGFVGSDSLPLVVSSRLTDPEAVLRLFTSPVLAGTTFTLNEVVYRPFVPLTFGLDYLVWGRAAFGYHITNLGLHMATVAAVWLLLRGLGLSAWSSALGAALFALHPVVVATEPVIARRDSILPVTAFTLGAASLVQASHTANCARRRLLIGASLLLTAVALLSKETAFVAVALLPIVLAAAQLARGGNSLTAARRAALYAWPHFVLAAALFGVRLVVLGGLGGIGDADITEMDPYQYGTLLASYAREHYWAFANFRPMTRELWLGLGAATLAGVLLMVAWLPRRQAALVAAGALWVVAFGFFSAIFKVTTIGWLSYFALVGSAMLVAAGFEGALQRLWATRFGRLGRPSLSSYAPKLRRFGRPGTSWHMPLSGVTLVAVAIFFVVSIADSALFRDYPQWQLAGDAQASYLQALASCVSAMPDVWDEEYVSLQRVPAAYQDGRLETDMLGVTMVEQYTAETALRQAFPERRMLVHVGSVATLHSTEMQLTCAPLPHGLEFTAMY